MTRPVDRFPIFPAIFGITRTAAMEDTVTEQPITRDLNPSGEALTVAVRMIVEPTGIRYTASASAGDHGVVGGGPGYWAEGPTPEVALYELERVVRRHQNLPVSE